MYGLSYWALSGAGLVRRRAQEGDPTVSDLDRHSAMWRHQEFRFSLGIQPKEGDWRGARAE